MNHRHLLVFTSLWSTRSDTDTAGLMAPKQAVCWLSADAPKIEFDTGRPTAMVRTRLHFIRLRRLSQLWSIHSFIHSVSRALLRRTAWKECRVYRREAKTQSEKTLQAIDVQKLRPKHRKTHSYRCQVIPKWLHRGSEPPPSILKCYPLMCCYIYLLIKKTVTRSRQSETTHPLWRLTCFAATMILILEQIMHS